MPESIYIRSRGGRISVTRLQDICRAAIRSQIETFSLTPRQEILISESPKKIESFRKLLDKQERSYHKESGNTVSSIMTFDVFPSTNWLNQGVFSKVITSLPEDSPFTFSFIDPKQNYVPQLDSQLNFIASNELNYWYLVVDQLPGQSTPYTWPVMIGTDAIYQFVSSFEKYWKEESADIQEVAGRLNSEVKYNNLAFLKEFSLENEYPLFPDGFYGLNPTYLFINMEKYSFAKCNSMLSVCFNQDMPYVYFNAWSGFVIGPINNGQAQEWGDFLARESIKTGKAQYELNWRVETGQTELRRLRKKLTRYFFDSELRVNGTSFSLARSKEKLSNALIQIVLRKNIFGLFYSYDLIYNDLGKEKVVGRNMSFTELKTQLGSTIQFHQKHIKQDEKVKEKKGERIKLEEWADEKNYACTECDTLYVPELGLIMSGILPNTSFELLDENFCCPTCGAPKSKFAQSATV